MTRAVFTRREDRWRMEMTGHADYDPGQDIVCSGCSALAYALANYLRGLGVQRLEERLEPGAVTLEAGGGPLVAAAFWMAAVGMERIAKGYPANVRVEIGEHFF